MPEVRLTLEIQGLDELKRNINDPAERSRVLNAALQRIALAIHRAAGHSIRRKTGHTAGQLSTEQRGDLVWAVVSHGLVGLFLEFGTRAHLIAARNARALMLPVHPGAGAGGPTFGVTTGPRGTARLTGVPRRSQIAFFRSVHHPGQHPYPFMSTALYQSQNMVENVLAQAGAEIVSHMAAAGEITL